MTPDSVPSRTEYVFDNAGVQTPERFRGLEALYDEQTQRHIEARGIAAGWACLEVGGGSGSIARWMSDRVGADGRVLVTDIDPRHLASLAGGNVSVRQHDIGNDALDHGAFDLIHTRLVLVHVPRREEAIGNMIAALKPGGWLLLEEFDAQSMPPNPTRFGEHYLKTLQANYRAMLQRGVDHEFGRRLPGVMRQSGLQKVEAEGRSMLFSGGSTGAKLMLANFEQIKDDILATGLVSEREFEMDLERLNDPSVSWPSQIMWSAWGQKPAERPET